MKFFGSIALALCVTAAKLAAQPIDASAILDASPEVYSSSYAAVEADGNSCVLERTDYTNTASGLKMTQKYRYVHLEAGVNHLVNGQWVPSSDEIVILPDGSGAATNGQHQAYFPGNLNEGAITLVTPDGDILQSRPFILVCTDGDNIEVIGEIQDSHGQLVGSNQVVYPDAFKGIKADVRITNFKGGFEQDIILREQIPTPESLGLDPAKTKIEVMTEFFDPPAPEFIGSVADDANKIQDTGIKLGGMRMILGKAFSTTDANQRDVEGVPVFKDWVVVSGRSFLVEKLPIKNIDRQLKSLPLHASASKPDSNIKMALSLPAKNQLPSARPIQSSKTPILLAKSDYNKQPGVVLDYVLLPAGPSNFVFQADTTYFMTGYYFQIDGLVTFEGGTVIKFDTSTANFQLWYGGISCQSSPYRPIIMTAKDDDTVGEIISGSTGNPTGYYGNGMTIYNNNSLTLHDIRMSYLGVGINAFTTIEFDNIQAINCSTPIVHLWAGTTINNGLFYNIGGTAVLAGGGASSVTAAHLTIDNCSTFADSNTLSLTLVNSLVTATTNLLAGTGTLTTNKVTVLASNSGVYQTVGAGSHYLANGSSYRAAGTNAIDATLLAGLPSRTTYPPVIYSNQTISVSTNFPIQAKRDTNSTPDLGYHYDPIDYITDNLIVTNATLTMSNGVAIACYNEPGITLQGNGALNSIGTPLLPNWFVRYQSVQEKSVFLGGTNAALGQNLVAASLVSNRSSVTIKFTRFAVPANGGFVFSHSGNSSFNTLTVQHSEIWGGTNIFSGPTNAATVSLFNNLFFRSGITASNASSTAGLAFTNNLIYGACLSLKKPSAGNWYFFNNDLDSCAVDSASVITNGYNAFINCSNSLSGPGTITTTNAISYQAGTLGVFYQPTNSALINVGNAAANQIGLGYFTTQTNQVADSNSVVDIGYHYVALNGSGSPLDLDANGIPDYLEATGNQSVSITTQPTNQTVALSYSATFTVVATGTSPLTYQWWFKGTNKLASATNTSLVINNCQSTNAGNYTVVVTNIVNAVTSSVATLTVWIPPSVTITNPLNNAVFSAPTNLTINATNWDVSGLVTQAQFFTGTKLLATTTNTPFNTVWSNVPPGSHALKTVVLNNLGLSATSAVVNILIATNLSPLADAHVRDGSFANTNFGTNVLMEVQTSLGTGTNRDMYFKFDLSNITSNISSAQLKFYAAVTNATITNIIYSVTNISWAETNITWSNRPSLVTALVTNTVVGTNWFSFDVTSFVKSQKTAGQNTICLASHAVTNYTRFIQINSKENSTNKPYLLVATTNNPLSVTLTNPQNNAVFVAPTNIAINATASDGDGNVTWVQFFQGTNSLGIISNAPYNLVWSNAPTGTNLLTAVAFDDAGRTATSSIVSVTINTNSGTGNLPPGILYWWKAEGNANDSFGTNHGTFQAVSSYTNGEVGQAFKFNGSNSFVSTTINLDAPTNFSFEMWFKTTTTAGGCLIGFSDSQTGTPVSWDHLLYMDDTGKIHFGIYDGGVRMADSVSAYNDGNWHHVAGTMSATNGMSLYMDGVLLTNNPSATTVYPYTGWWRIGQNHLEFWPSVPTSYYFNGLIDEVSIYSRALASNEVYSIYAAGSIGKGFSSAPTVVITNPVNNAIFIANQTNVLLQASITSSSASISQVQFWQGGTLVGGVSNAPYSLTWSNVAAGNYGVTAVAMDNSGLSGTSAVVNITISPLFNTNAMKLWLKADSIGATSNGTPVASWTDSSGSGNNATQGTLVSQPTCLTNDLNGQPTVNFNGYQTMNLPSILSGSSPSEMFVVLKATNPPSTTAAIWNFGGNGYAPDIKYNGADGGIVDAFGSTSARNLGVTPQTLTQYHLYNVSASSTNWAAWINSQLVFQTTNNTVAYYSGGWVLGLVYYGFSGDVADLMIFNRPLTAAERRTVTTYLNSKYGLAAQIPLAPTNLVATAISSNQISLTWSEVLTNAGTTQISIERATSSNGIYQAVVQVPAMLSYIDTNLYAGTTYYYRIRAINLTQWSDYSSVVQVATHSTSGAAGIPFDTMVLWLKADAGLVQGTTNMPLNYWADQSGSFNHASQTVGTSRPAWIPGAIAGQPTVRFGGGSQALDLPNTLNSSLTAAGQAEVIFVLKASSSPGSANTLWYANSGNYYDSYYPYTDGTIREAFGAGGPYNLGVPTQPLTQYHAYDVSAQSNNWTAWINGVVLYQTTNNTISFDAFHPMILGWNGFLGDISEIMIFKRSLTAKEREGLNNYLASKYNLSSYATNGTAPGTPNFVLAHFNQNQANAQWSYSFSTTDYRLERKTGSAGSFQEIAVTGPTVYSYVDSIASATNQFYYRVRAHNFFGYSAYSTEIPLYLDANGDGIPDFLKVLSGDDPLNPWVAPALNTNDHTAPIINLLIPTNAVIIP